MWRYGLCGTTRTVTPRFLVEGGSNPREAALAASDAAAAISAVVRRRPTRRRCRPRPAAAAASGRARAAEANFCNLHSKCALLRPLSRRDDF